MVVFPGKFFKLSTQFIIFEALFHKSIMCQLSVFCIKVFEVVTDSTYPN